MTPSGPHVTGPFPNKETEAQRDEVVWQRYTAQTGEPDWEPRTVRILEGNGWDGVYVCVCVCTRVGTAKIPELRSQLLSVLWVSRGRRKLA